MKYSEVCEQINAIPEAERDQGLTGGALTAFHTFLNVSSKGSAAGQLEIMTRQAVAAVPDMAGRADLIEDAIYARLYTLMLRTLENGDWGDVAWPVSLIEVARRLATVALVYLADQQDTPLGVRAIYQQLYGAHEVARRAECRAASHGPLEVWLPSAGYMQRAGQPSTCPACGRALQFPS